MKSMQLIGLGTILSMFLLPMHSFAECLKEGQDVAFTGIVSREIFPGPPNYESINDGDTPETYWILTISLPQCVIAEPIEGGEPSEVARSVTRFQLVFEGADVYKLQKDVVGRSADMSGRVFTAISGHHHTEALIAVKTIKLLEQ